MTEETHPAEPKRAPPYEGRRENFDHAAVVRAHKEGFEAGGANSRQTIALLEASVKARDDEIARLYARLGDALEKRVEAIGQLQASTNTNSKLVLAERDGKVKEKELEVTGQNVRHAMTLGATSPYVGMILEKLMPELKLRPPRPPGPGNTPREAGQRFVAFLRAGDEMAKATIATLEEDCKAAGRPGDLGLLLDFFSEAADGHSYDEKPADKKPADKKPADPTPPAREESAT